MKTTPTRRLFLALTAATLALPPLHAQSLYWGSGGGGAWSTAANWFTDAGETAVSEAVPTSSTDVYFNTTPDNALGGTITFGSVLNYANSLTFNTSGATLLSQNNSGRNLVLGGGGITLNSGTGNATLGASSNVLRTQILQDQTWTNNSASTLNVRTVSASEFASGPVALTMNAASTGNITASLSYSDSNYSGSSNANNTLSIIVDSAGTGSVSLVGSTYTGGTTIRRGILSTNGTLGSGNIVVGETGGANDVRLNVTGVVTNDITVGSGTGLRALTGSGSGDLQGNISLNRDVSIGSVSSSATTFAVSGNISGAHNVTLGRVTTGTSNPTVTLSGDNTYTGKTTIESATVVVESLNSVTGGTASSSLGAPITIANGTISMSAVSASTLRYIGTGETTDRVIDLAGTTNGATIEQAGTGVLKFTSDLTATGNGSKALTLSGSTSGSGEISGIISNSSANTGITKSGTGTWRLSGENTYTGVTQIGPSGVVGGTLEVTSLKNGGVASSIGASSNAAANLVFGGTGTAGTLRYIGSGDSTNRSFGVGSIGAQFDASGTGAINWTNTAAPNLVGSNTARTITFKGTSTHANTMSAGFTNNGTGATSIIKSESGRWILAGNNTYSGATTVSGGTLGLSGSIANSATTVEDTATFHLAGGTAGTVTVNSGAFLTGSGTVGNTSVNGTLAIGNSPGTLTLADGAALTLGSGSVSDFEFTSSGFGLGSFDRVTGTAGGSLETATLGGTLNLVFTGTGYTEGADVARIFDLDSLTGTFTSVNVTGLEAYGLDAVFNSTTGYISLVGSTIPEPSAFAALAGFGVLVLAASRRRRVA